MALVSLELNENRKAIEEKLDTVFCTSVVHVGKSFLRQGDERLKVELTDAQKVAIGSLNVEVFYALIQEGLRGRIGWSPEDGPIADADELTKAARLASKCGLKEIATAVAEIAYDEYIRIGWRLERGEKTYGGTIFSERDSMIGCYFGAMKTAAEFALGEEKVEKFYAKLLEELGQEALTEQAKFFGCDILQIASLGKLKDLE